VTIAERLERAKANQDTYKPRDDVVRQLQGTTFVALIGITGIGKSHLIPYVTHQGGEEFSEVGNVSTRATRPSDPPSFRGGRPHKELLDQIENRQVVSYLAHPSGDIYVSDLESYKTRYVLLPTLTSALEQLERLGCFERVVPIGIVTDGATWIKRLDSKLDDPKLQARFDEALTCLGWLEKHAQDITILQNDDGQETVIADMIITLLKNPNDRHPNKETILSTIDSLKSAVESARREYNERKGRES
jgi:hypothetical protein